MGKILVYSIYGKWAKEVKSIRCIYPELSLKRAREIALDLRYKLKNTVEAEVMQPNFQEVAEDWFNNQKETWSSKHISNVRASLDELYIALANKPINQVQAPKILQIIKKIEARGSLEVAKRTLSRCGMVMKYAIAHGYRYDNPAGDLVYALKNKRVKNLASLPASDMPEFLRKVRTYPSDAQTHHAIILIMLTGVRVSELLQARWDEFDLEGRKWDIPEDRMKNRLPHRVPLTDRMIAELNTLRLTHNQELLFPHRLNNKESMRSESILAVIKRSGYAASNGLLSCLPLQLTLRGKSTTQSYRTPVYYVDLTLREGVHLQEAIQTAKEIDQQIKQSGFNQSALDAIAKQGFANARFEVNVEEGLDLVEEFYNEEVKQQQVDQANEHELSHMQDIQKELEKSVIAMN